MQNEMQTEQPMTEIHYDLPGDAPERVLTMEVRRPSTGETIVERCVWVTGDTTGEHAARRVIRRVRVGEDE